MSQRLGGAVEAIVSGGISGAAPRAALIRKIKFASDELRRLKGVKAIQRLRPTGERLARAIGGAGGWRDAARSDEA